MSTADNQSKPAIPPIPPRPSRSQEKGSATGPSPPAIPPRPTSKSRFNRSVSPNPHRFAPSPLNEAPFPPKGPLDTRRTSGHSTSHLGNELERPASLDHPGPGEEGKEYEVYEVIQDQNPSPEPSRRSSTSPEQTRTIAEDLKLHAPKPTMPPENSRQRVAAVTRTDSDRAAAFGIGRPSSTEQHPSNRSLKKKASTTSQLSQVEVDDGIPEIGQRVPMYPHAGDVQAPSPAPTGAPSETGGRTGTRSGHTRRSSSRGVNEPPPGSYGLHGHGVTPSDKLEKAYYEKHPELRLKERYKYLHDRPNDYSMSSEDLNKIVHDTASRGAGSGTSQEYDAIPSEEVGFKATEEYALRMSRPSSAAPKDLLSPNKTTSDAGGDNNVIEVSDRGHHKGYLNFGDKQSPVDQTVDDGPSAPILASDEVAKDPTAYGLHPAVEPLHDYRDDEPKSRPASRPTSRPTSVYSPPPVELQSTPLDDVKEYEPLFTDDEKSGNKSVTAERPRENHQRFPSRDVWEDAPNSVHATAEVSTPEVTGDLLSPHLSTKDVPSRENETPAQAFARKQEELAEKEAVTPDSFLYRQQKPPTYAAHQSHIAQKIKSTPSPQRFPSRDIWEDSPDSLQYTTTVSGPESGENTPSEGETTKADAPVSTSSAVPAIPTRPKKQGSGDDVSSKQSIPERPAKIQKSAPDAKQSTGPAATQKPPVPAKPLGGKIAALQAGFMSDLNKRLQLGPQAPKKEEPPAASGQAEEKEKVPLSDARKSRARGPQRRAPTRNTAATTKSTPPPTSANTKQPVLSFSTTRTLFSIDEEGTITVESEPMEQPTEEPKKSVESAVHEVELPKPQEPAKDPEDAADPIATESISQAPAEAEKSVEEEEESAENTEEAAKKPAAEEETKTLATNTAGQPILEETIEKKPGDQVEAVDNVKSEVVED